MTCAQCGRPLPFSRPDRMTCSPRCRQARSRARRAMYAGAVAPLTVQQRVAARAAFLGRSVTRGPE